jgi:hypothetical protein
VQEIPHSFRCLADLLGGVEHWLFAVSFDGGHVGGGGTQENVVREPPPTSPPPRPGLDRAAERGQEGSHGVAAWTREA